jgi:hypothetical protein
MKKKICYITFFVILVIMFVGAFVCLYNNVFMPFRGENKDILYSPTNYSIEYESEFKQFYYDFLEYENYEEKYDTEFYYCFGRKSLIPQYTLTFDKFARESYSYVVKCGEDYDLIKEKILTEIKFVDTPVLLSYESDYISYESFFDINGTIYQEIHYNYFLEEWEYQNPDGFRTFSYWFAYNDERKEIIFSYLYKDTSSDLITKDDAIFLMKNNLYS